MAKQYVENSYFSTIVGGSEIHLTDDNIKLEDGTNISKINTNMFQSNYRLKEVHFSQVTAVNPTAFQNCTSLSSVYLPALSNYSSNLLSGVTGLQSLVLSGRDTFSIPFNHNTSLNHISITGVTSLQSSAFYYCYNLSKGYFPQVASLGNSAFQYCSSVNELSFNNNLKSIPSYAFNGCQNLVSITGITFSKLTYIGSYAFNSCRVLNKPIMELCASYICSGAFNHCDLIESIWVSSGCISIGNEAFANCIKLKDIYIKSPDDIAIDVIPFNAPISSIYISNGVRFSSCSNFSTWSLKSTLTYLEINELISIPPYFCNYFSSKLKYAIFSSVTSIGTHAFANCFKLSDFTAPKTLAISSSAFYMCSSLSVIQLPSVKTIGEAAFYGCLSLKSINMPSVLTIGPGAFHHCSNLSFASLLNITTIGELAFIDCNKLKTLYTPRVTHVGAQAFRGCGLLESFSTNSSIYIYSSAFMGCNNLTTIYVPRLQELSSLTVFPFSTNSKISTLALGNASIFTRTRLSTYPFSQAISSLTLYNCYSLSSYFAYGTTVSTVELSSLSTIGAYAFASCSNLSFVSIYSFDGEISSHAFDAKADYYIRFNEAIIRSIGESAFYASNGRWFHTFENTSGWTFLLDHCYNIGSSAFHNDNYLTFYFSGTNALDIGTNLKQDGSITKIGARAFQNITFNNVNRSYVAINISNCNRIGSWAFWGAQASTSNGTSITFSIRINDTVAIDNQAFDYLRTNVHSLVFSGVSTISTNAFAHMSVSRIDFYDFSPEYLGTITGSVGRIDNFAFASNPNLTYVYFYASSISWMLSGNGDWTVFEQTGITSTTGYIYVRSKYYNAYRSNATWSYYRNRIYSF